MQQCPDCKTFKKADNCIRCVVKERKEVFRLKEVIEKINNVFEEQLPEYKKLDKIQNIVKGEMYI